MWRRHEIAVLCAIGTLLCYADRTNIGVALPSIEPDHKKQGEILSSFFYGYICTQFLGAYWASRYGPKRVLLIGVLIWTCFDLLTVVTASNSAFLSITRAGMGLGEGILFPTMHVIAATWYPQNERSRLMSFVSSGVDLGTILSMAFSPLLLHSFGWRSIFFTFGGLSVLWLVIFTWRGSSEPDTDPYITSHEKATIKSSRESNLTTSEPIPWRLLLTNRGVWAIYCAHFAFNYGWYVLLCWMPLYFREKLHVPLASSGFTSSCPYLAGYIGVLFWGWISDYFITIGKKPFHVRKAMNFIGFFGASLCLFSLQYAKSTPVAVILLSLTLFMGRAATLGYWIHMVDICPSQAGNIMGISNTIGSFPGIFGNLFTGWLLSKSNKNWNIVFGIVSFILFLGGFLFHYLSRNKLSIKKNKKIKKLLNKNEFYI